MSKFLSYHNLFPIPDPKEFLGMSADKQEGNVIITLARNVVVILNISTHKQLHSWSMPEKLSTKVIYDSNSQKYVGVFGNHALRLWDVDTLDVAKSKKLKFQKSIAHVVTAIDEAFVLFCDGSCQPLSRALESRKDQKENSAEQLALAASKSLSKPTVHTFHDGRKVLTFFEENHATGEVSVIRRCLSNFHKRAYVIKRETVRLTGHAVLESDIGPQLMTIWSDKRIFILNLGEQSHETAPGQFVSMIAELNVETKLSVCGLSPNFAAIYGANYGQEGASLLVYNTQFKVINAKQYFKVYLDFSRLWAHSEFILLAMGQNIAAVRYRMNNELLADMLGSQLSEVHLTPIELDHINEEESLEAALQFIGNSNHEVSTIKHAKLLKQSVSGQSPADGKSFAFESPKILNREVNELIAQHVDGESLQVEFGLEDVNIMLMTNYFDAGPQNLAVQSIIRQLERSGAGQQEITEKLLTLFLKTQNTKHVLMCVRRYMNISEHMLAWCLRYALDSFSDIKTHDTVPQSVLENNELLNTVLACKFNSVTIKKHLKKRLELSHVLRLIKYLYVLASDTDLLLEERPNLNTAHFGKSPTELQAFQWLGALLTSHFTLLTTSQKKPILDVLTLWSDRFQLNANLLESLSRIVPLLSKIIAQHNPIDPYPTMWYGIEMLKLY